MLLVKMAVNNPLKLKVVSFNMHGFNQGISAIKELIDDFTPDVFLIQEHWLTEANLNKFDLFTNYFSFGCSAMTNQVASSILVGRPYGGVITLIKNELRQQTTTIHCDDRFVIVVIGNYLFINVYMPCRGTVNRSDLCDSLLCDIWSWRERFMQHECIIAGDMNADLCKDDDSIANRLNSFFNQNSLIRCNDLFRQQAVSTYVNFALDQESCIDYVFGTSRLDIVSFDVLDLNLNFSDHLPLLVCVNVSDYSSQAKHKNASDNSCIRNRAANDNNIAMQLRWDKADILAFYHYTGLHLQPVLTSVESMCQSASVEPRMTDCM